MDRRKKLKSMKLRLDCIYYLGEKPCSKGTVCWQCPSYKPRGKRILIIKLGAMGDVLRTTPLLRGLKRSKLNCHITWITEEESYDLLKNNPFIDRLLIYNLESILRLQVERFEQLICLDKEAKAAALAMLIKAEEKLGIGLSPEGSIYPLNKEAEYYFLLGLSDELKFHRNQKTYQEMIFELAKLKYQREEYILEVGEEDKRYAQELFKKLGIREGSFVIGLFTGAGSVFANKSWGTDSFIHLANWLGSSPKVEVALLGGPLEKLKNNIIKSNVSVPLYDTGCENSLSQFCGLVSKCDLIVAGDTVAMHIGIALGKVVVALFGPTCAQEIDLYHRGRKIVSTLECAPCYKRSCERVETCMSYIKVEEVYQTIAELCGEKGVKLCSPYALTKSVLSYRF